MVINIMAERLRVKYLDNLLGNIDELLPTRRAHILRYLIARDMLKYGNVVMDVACGTGYGSLLFARHKCKVIGVDISPKAIQFAEKYNNHKNIRWVCDDVINVPKIVRQPLDAIVCFETLEHLPDRHEEILTNFKLVLKPGCPAICSIPLDHPDDKWHKKVFSFKDRENLFASCFKRFEYSDKNGSLVIGWNDV